MDRGKQGCPLFQATFFAVTRLGLLALLSVTGEKF